MRMMIIMMINMKIINFKVTIFIKNNLKYKIKFLLRLKNILGKKNFEVFHKTQFHLLLII